MSSDLGNTARLSTDGAFRDLVQAAMVEHAVQVIGVGTDVLAAAVVYDVTGLASFVRLCADDAVMSATGWEYDIDDIRRVVAGSWSLVAAAVPNIGG